MVVTDRGSLRLVTVIEMYSLIFRKLNNLAHESLGQHVDEYEIKKAYITVSDEFDESQKVAMRDAADMAGLTIVDMITETQALYQAYGLDEGNVNLLIDFGGTELKLIVQKNKHKACVLM